MALAVSGGRVMFQTVHEAFVAAGIEEKENDPTAILVWNDTIKDADYFSSLKPYQMVNRIPEINYICRKAPFVRVIQRIAPFFPDLFTFLPTSFILPINNAQFLHAVSKHDKKYIVKPDGGSLGRGIQIIEPNQDWEPQLNLAIAQEYVESRLVRNTKFDLRIYALVASISPLRIYVYREGIARFCSETVDSESVFSQLTNTAVNRHNSNVNITNCTKLVSETFSAMQSEGVDIPLLWSKIDSAIVLTIISTLNYLTKSAHIKCPSYGLPRCFQILGFDVLISRNLTPIILEVNYRPSLEFDTEYEHQMKVKMLSEAMRIACPYANLQQSIRSRTSSWNDKMWASFIQHNGNLLKQSERNRKAAEVASDFVLAYPISGAQQNDYDKVMAKVKTMPTSSDTHYSLPGKFEESKKRVQESTLVAKQILTKPKMKKRSKSPQKIPKPLGPLGPVE